MYQVTLVWFTDSLHGSLQRQGINETVHDKTEKVACVSSEDSGSGGGGGVKT